MKKVFVANDGKNFETEAECLAHEKKLSQKNDTENIIKKFKKEYDEMFDRHDREIDLLEDRHGREEEALIVRQEKEVKEFFDRLVATDKKYPKADIFVKVNGHALDAMINALI